MILLTSDLDKWEEKYFEEGWNQLKEFVHPYSLFLDYLITHPSLDDPRKQ